ncbi:hypothetical protein BJ878DRAFT_517063 [Calycina marina]|uniref:Uncharacterized protein n=1 Tax=Calycina marina TaxID=1763456 RepID=A0A9P8CEA8_9HELO|nr:hypothetical protein BJ878DRAFT_517063 [Calycina marina]
MSAFLSTFRSNKSVLENLSKLFTKDNEAENRSAAVSSIELGNFKKNFKTNFSSTSTELPEELLSFYAGYPFSVASKPFSHDGLLRAVVFLAGKDLAFSRQQSTTSVTTKEKTVILCGRSEEDRLLLLYRALAGASPTINDVLDVLCLVQPRPNPTIAPLGRDELTPMARKLFGSSDIESICQLNSIPQARFDLFAKAVVIQSLVEADVDFEEFASIAKSIRGFLEKVAASAEAYFR